MIELSREQRQVLSEETPPKVRDPETNEIYVLIKTAVYERFRQMLQEEEDGLDMRRVGALIDEAMREDDADDPLLESYQNYRRSP